MNFLDTLAFKAIRTIFSLMSRIPLQTGRRLGACIGNVWYVMDKRHRRVALENLNLAFADEKSPAEIGQLSRRVFRNLGKIMFEMAWSLSLRPEEIKRYVQIVGHDHIRHARARNNGILVLTGHLGNWELMTFLGVMNRSTTHIVYRPLDFKPMDRFIGDVRTRYGARLIPKSNATLKILKSMKRNEDVALLFDQRVNKRKGIFVDFFGEPACTAKGVAFLALKAGSPVLPVFMLRTEEGFRAEIGEDIPLIRTGDLEEDIRINTERYNDCIEKFVHRYPDQWFWVHRRWKLKPD